MKRMTHEIDEKKERRAEFNAGKRKEVRNGGSHERKYWPNAELPVLRLPLEI